MEQKTGLADLYNVIIRKAKQPETMALIVFTDDSFSEVLVALVSSGGEPENLGQAIAVYLSGLTYSSFFKDGDSTSIGIKLIHSIGSRLRLMKAGTRGVGERYIYTITTRRGSCPRISVMDVGGEKPKKIFGGTCQELLEWLETDEEGDECVGETTTPEPNLSREMLMTIERAVKLRRGIASAIARAQCPEIGPTAHIGHMHFPAGYRE